MRLRDVLDRDAGWRMRCFPVQSGDDGMLGTHETPGWEPFAVLPEKRHGHWIVLVRRRAGLLERLAAWWRSRRAPDPAAPTE